MEVKLEVLLSTSIKQKKPWPRISWLGQEKEAIFLLDDKNINEINLPSGKTKKKIPRLQLLLKNTVILTTSRNDAWLAGVLNTGEIFLWNKDQDCLKTVSATEESKTLIIAALECSLRLYIYVSGDGKRVLLTTPSGYILLWECLEFENIIDSKHSSLLGQWSQIKPEKSIVLPSPEDKEAVVDAVFIRNELLGDCCLCSFTFYSGEYLILTFLALQWHENQPISSLSYQVHWAHQECFLCTLIPKCESVKSRGALIIAFSMNGLTLAVTLNQKDPKATQILFVNILNFVTLCGSLKGCSNKNPVVPSRLIRSYWVGDISWTHDSLFLACVLKRGSLVLLTCLGELLTLITFGCSIEFGPAEFIPLHPLITYRPQQFIPQDSSYSLDSSASDNDLMRQRFSVKTHSRLPYLIVSDGYMVTVLRFFDNLSPSVLMKSFLLESTQRLEKIHQGLISQPKGKNLRLRSLDSLRSSLLKHQGNQNSVVFAIPKFLQPEEEIGELTEKMADLQDHEMEESSNSKHFPSRFFPFWNQRSDSFFDEVDGGRLEFASMFDTIHAKDDVKGKDDIITELHSIQKNLLAAWSIGISKNVEHKKLMLNYTVICITHFLYILQFVKCPSPKQKILLNKTTRHNAWLHCVFQLFHHCLSVQYWDLRYSQDVGHLVKLTSQTLKLMFIQQQQDQLFSDTLLGCFNLLKMVSDSLNDIYTLKHQVISTSADGNRIVPHESLMLPIFQNFFQNHTQKWSWNSFLKLPPQTINLVQKPGHRLSILWQLLYKQTLWYQTHLSRMDPKDDRQLIERRTHEASIVSSLLCHIQAILQTAGYCLNQALELKSVIGEEYFLLGSYEESVQLWKKALQETKAKGGKRTCFLQTRYYLAQLYCHLYCYNLNDAQGMCDHLVREILRQSQMSIKKEEYFPVSESFHCDFGNVHPEAAVVVVQCLARFMAAYFTNQPLYVLPPHNVNVLPPLHIESEQSVRIIPLQHSKVASVIRDQNLSYLWTVEYALELLFITGLVPEAVWLAHRLGDWKMAVSIGLAFKLCYKSSSSLSRLKKKDSTLPLNMTPTQIFQEKLQYFLGQPAPLEVANELGPKYKQFTDPIEEEDVELLFNSIQEVLKAAVMADADILSETFQLLIDSAKHFSKKLWGLVPMGLYLPSPPLYCPQPAVLSEDHGDDLLLKAEKDYRQKLSGILQRILLLFRAACCSFPAAQWYILKLRWARKVMQKIRIKGSLPLLSPFPESLLHYCKVGMAFYQPGTPEDHKLDEVSYKSIGCFRELCALCWMLHVREKLSYSCRRYQIAREHVEKTKDMELEFDPSVVEHCFSALEWACRMLPFSRFLNIEELVQDIILSLIGELPPTRKVAEILVKAFPNSEDIRVPLRDKYNSLQQRLRHSTVRGPHTEEMMSVTMHSIYKVRVKALKRVRRNIGPFEMYIWEPPEDETVDNKIHTYDRFSLGTNLSRSTLTEEGNTLTHSDAETVDIFSEALPSEKKRKNAQNHAAFKHNMKKKKKFISEECSERKGDHENFSRKNIVPIVGVWEFERDDDEYIKFLDLFLSYVLEKDLVGSNNSGIPFLSSFSAHLKEHELNSLLFDVHTTLKRRQGKPTCQNVFRAGSCYVTVLESSESEKSSTLNNENFRNLGNQTSLPSVLVVQGPRCFIQNSSNEVVKSMGKKGLFGLKEKSLYRIKDDNREMPMSPRLPKQVFLQPNFKTPKLTYKAVQWNDIIPHEELSPELKNKFGNIAKLLEWMIRWSDRRLLCDSVKPESSCQTSPVIRVRTSATAILTSLWLVGQSHFVKQASHVISKAPENHYSVPSVLIPDNKHNIKKERSIDTDDPALGPTPNEIQEVHNISGSNDNFLEITTQSKHPEIEELIEESFSVTHVTDKEFTDFDEYLLEERETFTDEETKAPDCGENSEESFPSLKTTDTSISLRPLEKQSEEQHSIKNVDCPLKESVEKLAKTSFEQKGMAETVVDTKLTTPHSFCLDTNADTPSIQVSVPKDRPSSVPPVVSDTTSVSSHTPISRHRRDHKDEAPAQLPNSSESISQVLHDELFRLVQLQQINFMSLMQILGSSFASFPSVQLTQQSQNAHLEGSQILGPTRGSGDVESTNTNLKNEFLLRTIEENSRQFEKSRPHPEGTVRSDQNKIGNIQNIPSFCVPLGHSDDQSNNGEVIPKCQTLSSTPGPPSFASSHHFHLLSSTTTSHKSPTLIPTVKTLSPANGFPLLKIQRKHEFKPLSVHSERTPQVPVRPPPEPKKAWGLFNSGKKLATAESISPTSHLNLSQYDVEAVQKALEQKRWAEIRTTETLKHLNLDQYVEQENMAPQQRTSAEKGEKIFDVKPESPELPNQNFFGVPLLHLQLNPTTMFSTALTASVSAPSPPHSSKEKERDSKEILYPSLKLLHTCFPPERKCQKPKFIPLENLNAFKHNQQKQSLNLFEFGEPRNVHILKAKVESKKENKKRERRRAKKDLQEKGSEKKEKKLVTIQSEDSIIKSDDLEVVVKQKDPQEQPIPQSTDCFVIPLESLEEDITTSAGLHYMASVRKKVVENQDASTNTDPVQEYLNAPQILAPDVYLNLRFPSGTTEAPLTSDPTSNVVGHSYINVIDIEATDLLQELPIREETTDDIVNKQEANNLEIPSSANLHYMAASVTNVIPPDQFVNKDLPEVQPQVQESTVKSDDVKDYLTQKWCQDFSASPYTVPSEKNLVEDHPNTKFLEIDEKPLVLQNIVTKVEQDFSNTKLPFTTEDPLEISFSPEMDKETTFSQVFRSPEEEYSFNHQIEEEEETPLFEFPETKHTVWNSCSFSSVISSFNASSDYIASTGTAHSEDSFGSVSADFQITGLTDVADIINDLITESGVSYEELGLTEHQAKKISRIHGTPKRRKSQRTEKEKREIRAWMKKKRKERMAEYLAQLAKKREQEYEPFQPQRQPFYMTSKEIRLCQKMKNEKDRLQLSEHYHCRVAQAYNLMNELLLESAQVPKRSLTKPPVSPAKSTRISGRWHYLPPKREDRNINTLTPSRNSKVRFASKPTYIHGRTTLNQHQHSSQRNRLNQRVTCISLSEMATNSMKKKMEVTKRSAHSLSCSPGLFNQDFDYSPQRTSSVKSSETITSRATAEEYQREHDKGSSWTIPTGVEKIPYRSPNSSLEDFSLIKDEEFPISLSGLDSGSESTGSILSKIDWRAIDDMVAMIENT